MTVDFVNYWAAKYPVTYDRKHYDPFIADAERGDPAALRKLTEWKNVGGGMCPMRLSKRKEAAFQFFLKGIGRYLPTGSDNLKRDFAKRAPVYSIFWHHVLFGTPIFDVHTNRAFVFFRQGKHLKNRAAAIRAGAHWSLYAEYCKWFGALLSDLRTHESGITERHLDRALFMWGQTNKGALSKCATRMQRREK